MKWLYIWDDLNLFSNNPTLLKEARTIIKKLISKPSSEVSYQLLSTKSYQEFYAKIKSDFSLAIGSRPHILLERLKKEHSVLTICRQHNEAGHSVIYTMPLTEAVKSFFSLLPNRIHIYEDVCVSGQTLLELNKIVNEMNIDASKVTVHIFCANKKSVNELKKNTRFSYHVLYFMEGTALQDSTLLCLYDLMFGKLGNSSYTQRRDLLEKFFPDRFQEFVESINKIKKIWRIHE